MQFTWELIIVATLATVSALSSLILLVSLRRVKRHYDRLTEGIDKKTLTNALQGIQQSLVALSRQQDSSQAQIDKLKASATAHVQHLTLKRFNPFGDTGGDQSFILALLDGNLDGVVITSLHSRENTRFYVKSVSGGVGTPHPLSDEEQKLISRKGK